MAGLGPQSEVADSIKLVILQQNRRFCYMLIRLDCRMHTDRLCMCMDVCVCEHIHIHVNGLVYTSACMRVLYESYHIM